MLFFHIIDDYFLQGCLAQLKQQLWWQKNEPELLYRNDYKMALFMHSFSWSFSIMIPLLFFLEKDITWAILLAYPINTAIHYFIDDLKANKRKINLIVDQLVHVAQIVLTWAIYVWMI